MISSQIGGHVDTQEAMLTREFLSFWGNLSTMLLCFDDFIVSWSFTATTLHVDSIDSVL